MSATDISRPGAASIEADYDAFIAELTKLGAADYEALYTEVYPD